MVLTQWFTPEPTFKGLLFAQALARKGHVVTVITGFPNYPGGKVYQGYTMKLFQREVFNDVTVYRVPLYPSHDKSIFGRFLNYMSFAVTSSVAGLFVPGKFHAMYVYHPPATIGFPAIMIKLFRRIPFVYDIQDLWPDTLRSTGMINDKVVLSLVGLWCSIVYRMADMIVVLSPGFKTELAQRGVPEEKIEVIYNWCDEQNILRRDPDTHLEQQLGLRGLFKVVYTGNIGKAQALNAVLKAAKIVQARSRETKFIFVGNGIVLQDLKKEAEDLHLDNVLFLPQRPISKISEILNLADVVVVHLKDDPLFRITIPGKTQTYLAIGRPILMGVRGDAAALITDAKAGVTCIPENPSSIAEGIERLHLMSKAERDVIGNNGYEYYWRHLSMEVGVDKLERVLMSLLT